MDDEGVSGAEGGGGLKVWQFKTERLIEQSMPVDGDNSIRLFMDVDIAVYGELLPIITKTLENYDIVFQSEYGDAFGEVNIGVIAFRPSEKLVQFWRDIMQMIKETGQWDQAAVNKLIADPDYAKTRGIRFGVLPSSFWARTQMNYTLPIQQCVLHHANLAISIVEKWEQLNHFRPIFEPSPLRRATAFNFIKSHLHRLVWTFGNLINPTPYGNMTFTENLKVETYSNHNETRMLPLHDGFAMISADGKCTAIFNEFYLDYFRKKLCMVGPIFSAQPAQNNLAYHYLYASF
jgi:hypothetical protein